MQYLCAGVALILVSVSGCSADAPSEPTSRPREVASKSIGAGASGYHHHLEVSKFKPGGAPLTTWDNGFEKVVGTDGVFATATNGAILAVPNAGAASTSVASYGATAEEHNAFVRNYFTSAGLPDDQVESVNVGVLGTKVSDSAGGSVEGTASSHYVSVLRRVVVGVPVVDSVAWAQVNANGDVVAETVYWPPIPSDAISEAASLLQALKNPAVLNAYLAKLPPGASSTGVVIRHTSFAYAGGFVARAAYDAVYTSGGAATTRHFDAAGAEFKLPEEVESN